MFTEGILAMESTLLGVLQVLYSFCFAAALLLWPCCTYYHRRAG
jgi:hypothetical protein